jgi:hypothetical protein
MSEALNTYVEEIKRKEQAPQIADGNLVDEESFRKNYTARSQELKTLIDSDQTLDAQEKGQLWASVEAVSEKHFGELADKLALSSVENKEELRKVIEGLNYKAFELLIKVRKTIDQGGQKSIDSEKILGDMRKDNFERNLKILDRKVEHLAFLHRELEKCKTEGGVMEAVFGRMQAYWEEQIEKYTEEVVHEYANMAVFTKIVYPEGQGQFNIISNRMNFVMGQEHAGFWGEIGTQFTTKEGWSDMWEALKAYTTGVVKGVLSIIDPRTYFQLAEMIGQATASLIFCDDNWEKIQNMINEAGTSWSRANANEKCEMLGHFMGSLVGAKGVHVVGKSSFVQKGVLAKDVGTPMASVARKIATGAYKLVRRGGPTAGAETAVGAAEVAEIAVAGAVATEAAAVTVAATEATTTVKATTDVVKVATDLTRKVEKVAAVGKKAAKSVGRKGKEIAETGETAKSSVDYVDEKKKA